MQRQALAWRAMGIRVAFVPTMGCLHAGHLSLVQRAQREVGAKGRVVVSIYVNPTQFGPAEDFSRYPRPLSRDLALCREAGVDVVFTPTDAAMYAGQAEGSYSTYVVEERLSQSMEGRARPTHFRGVTTIVTKLFNIVQPSVAVFGAKDWQQAAIVRRMVADLNLPVRMLVAPTLREPDGLAMSSRNRYLDAAQRTQATVLWHSIQLARKRAQSAPVRAPVLKAAVARLIATQSQAKLDYVEFFDGDTLEPAPRVRRGTHMALAVFVGKTRLIDNAQL
ncbi:MAG: pantoate--beta-alanine ligase [Verrucomicrobia bacterium]|nr:pantoate--beta-alanine ligase [Verrucomicrobiota bacterium]